MSHEPTNCDTKRLGAKADGVNEKLSEEVSTRPPRHNERPPFSSEARYWHLQATFSTNDSKYKLSGCPGSDVVVVAVKTDMRASAPLRSKKPRTSNNRQLP